MSSRDTKIYAIFEDETATLAGSKAVSIDDFKNPHFEILGFNGANATIKIKGSLQETLPDFTAAISKTNRWAYVTFYDYTQGLAVELSELIISGDTVANLLPNVDGLRWAAIEISAYVGGDISANTVLFNNQ